MHSRYLIFSVWLYLVYPSESKSVTRGQNQTMRFYVFPMTNQEGDSIQRQSRQSTGNNGNPDLPPAGTVANVVNIVAGLLQEDVRPIVSGGTAFIPAGGLREGVTGILQGLAPALQKILFGANSNLPPVDYTIPTAAPIPRTEPPTTTPRPRRRRTTTPTPEQNSSSPNPYDGSEEETETPFETTLAPISSSTLIQLTLTSDESEEDASTQGPPTETSSSSPSPSPPQATNVGSLGSEAVTSESSQVTPESAQPTEASQSPLPSALKPQNTGSPSATQLKVILEDSNSIVTANVVNSADGEEKKYIYLVLLPDQYAELTKMESMSQVPMSIEIEADGTSTSTAKTTNHIDVTTADTDVVTSSTPKSIRYSSRNRNRTTTAPPPHLQLQFYKQSIGTTTTTTTMKTTSTDVPGVKGFEIDDDELES